MSKVIRSDDGAEVRCIVRPYSSTNSNLVISNAATLTLEEDTTPPPVEGDNVYYSGTTSENLYATSLVDGRTPLPGDFDVALEMFWEGSGQPSNNIFMLRHGFSSTQYNWALRQAHNVSAGTSKFTATIRNGSTLIGVVHPDDVPIGEWFLVEFGSNAGVGYLRYGGTEENETVSWNPTVAAGNYTLFTDTSSQTPQGWYVRNLGIEEDEGAYKLFFPCNEGEGLVWTETEQGENGFLSNDELHAEDPDPDGEIPPPGDDEYTLTVDQNGNFFGFIAEGEGDLQPRGTPESLALYTSSTAGDIENYVDADYDGTGESRTLTLGGNSCVLAWDTARFRAIAGDTDVDAISAAIQASVGSDLTIELTDPE